MTAKSRSAQRTPAPSTPGKRPAAAPVADDSGADGGRSAVGRTVAVIRAFTLQSRWGVRELAAELGIPKSGLHRTLQELAGEGLLDVDEAGTYSTAAGLLHLAAEITRSVDLTRIALPHLREACAKGGETTILVTYDPQRRQITALEAAETSNPIQFAWRSLRDWIDLHHSASGKGVMAFLDDADLDDLLSKPLRAFDGSAIDPASLRGELAEIRRRGYAATCNARVMGSCGVAAPVFDASRAVIGGVVIAWPQRPHDDHDGVTRKLGALCRRTADAISRDLGLPS